MLDKLHDLRVVHCGKKMDLGGKIPVQGADGDAGASRYIVHLHTLEIAAGTKIDGGLENTISPRHLDFRYRRRRRSARRPIADYSVQAASGGHQTTGAETGRHRADDGVGTSRDVTFDHGPAAQPSRQVWLG
jgi:hypothetical protein